jgi:hypothetical protein
VQANVGIVAAGLTANATRLPERLGRLDLSVL